MYELFKPYTYKLSFTFMLVVLESIAWILFPFLIGIAINDYLQDSFRGLVLFGILGIVTLLLMTMRRLYDTRLYSEIYEKIGVASAQQPTAMSIKTARINMLREIIEFFEHAMPELVNNIAVLFGSLFFLAFLNIQVFIASLVVSLIIALIYGITSKRTVQHNRSFNDEYEKQVDIITSNDTKKIQQHIKRLNNWTIKLSDIETINFGASWILVICLQLFAIVIATNEAVAYGTILSIVLYVFEFTETSVQIPDSWQEYLRLRDILKRVKNY